MDAQMPPGFVTATLTATGRQLMLDWMLGTVDDSAPDEVWLALCVGAVSDSDTGESFNELPGVFQDIEGNTQQSNYTRVPYPFGASATVDGVPAWESTGYGSYVNTREWLFNEADSDWPWVTGWALLDAQLGGRLIAYGPLSIQVLAGDQVSVPARSFSLAVVPLAVM